jgi:hypothetical protein
MSITTVCRDGWNVSTTSTSGIDGVILGVFKLHRINGRHLFQYGSANGKKFECSDDAWAYALDRGYLQPFVHEWCLKCRKVHYFMGSRSGWCPDHKEFTGN